ncbi:MAG: 4'-phosphopantetheinyl transferase superfamily protein [Bacteroidales bacterium]|nr:4'-phosphopantetheinyl transferase superfamily protein [Bacteroidales bacterium]
MVLTFFELEKITDEVFELWLKKLPKFRQDEVLRYRFRDDRVRSLCAYLLLCVGLGRIVEYFSYNEHGKPLLLDEHLHINLSHAKSAVVAGFSETPIGVDVEFIRKTYPKIVCKRVFTPSEIAQIENANSPTLAFFKFWTLKESYVKCIGQGLSFPLKTVEFKLVNEKISCSDNRFIISTFTQNQHQISVCATEQQAVRNLSFEDFFDLIKRLPRK